MTPLKARILLADDHTMVRRGLRALLDAQPDLEVTAEAGDGREAVTAVREGEFDLAILDVTMPRLTGLQAARAITEEFPDQRMLILSMHHNEQYFFEAVLAGASGYVLKSAADHDLVQACRAVLRGESFIYPPAARRLMQEFLARAETEGGASTDPLTPRETEVIKLVAEGATNQDIATELVISEKTVERHRANILEKLGMHDRVELTRYAIRRGLVEA